MDKMLFAHVAPLLAFGRRNVRIRGHIQGQQVMRGGFRHGLFVERDGRVARIVRLGDTMLEESRIGGESRHR